MHTVLFDLDGTLIDHFTTIHRAYAHAQKTLGLPIADYDTVRQKVGGSIHLTMKRLIGEDPRYDEAIHIFKEHFAEIMYEDVEILPGALEICASLKDKGHKLAVFTNKYGPHARAICDHLGISPFMELVIGAEDTPYRKPQKQFSEIVLERLGISPAQAIMIGDSPFDVEAARIVDMHATYVVATGSHSVEQLTEETDADGVFPNMLVLGQKLFNF